MSTVAVTVRRVEPRETPYASELERDLANARKIAVLLDSQFSVGGFKFGIDGIIGLVPGIGDFVSTALGAYLLFIAKKHRLGGGLMAMMLLNLTLDWLVGLVPVLGDVFDMVFKANLRNLALLEKAAARRRPW